MIGKSSSQRLIKLIRSGSAYVAILFCHACTGIESSPSSVTPSMLSPDALITEGLPTQDSSLHPLWQQGSLIKGRVVSGSHVEFLGNDVYVNEQGEFVLGLGRDAPSKVDVVVTDSAGIKHVHTFDVALRQYDIQRVVGVEEKYVTPSEKDQQRIDHENALIGAARRLRDTRADFADGFVWPLLGPISGVYGSQRFYNGEGRQPHYGVDIVAPVGTVVKAPSAGKVTFAYDMYYSGWTLVIDHGQGLSSSFLHLSKVLVKVGDTIKQGDPIAEVGATGRVTGAHLDWRMNWLDQRIDPQLLVPPMPPQQNGSNLPAPSATE